MKNYSLYLLLVLFNYNSFAQTIKIGEPYKSTSDNFRAYIPNGEELLILNSTDKTTVFQKANTETLSISKVNEVKLPKDIWNFERLIELGDKKYAFYSFIDSKTMNLFVGEIDLAKGGFKTALKELKISDGGLQLHPINPYIKNPYFTDGSIAKLQQAWDFKVLDDKKELLISRYNYSDTLLEFTLLDKDLEKIWTRKIATLPTNLDRKKVTITVADYELDSDKNIYVSTYATASSWLQYEQKAELCKVTATGQTSLISLEAVPYPIRNIWIKKGANGQLNCILTYHKTTQKHIIEGFAFGEIKDGKLVNVTTQDIMPSFYDTKSGVGTTSIAPAAFRCDLNKVILQKNGSSIYFFEFRYSDLYRDALCVRDILAFKVNADQSLAWKTVLPNYQQSGSTAGEVGSVYFSIDEFHYVLFLDSKENSKNYQGDVAAKGFMPSQKGVLTYYKINDNSGAVNKNQFFDVTGNNISNLHVNKMTYMGDGFLMIEGKKSKKEDVLIKIGIK